MGGGARNRVREAGNYEEHAGFVDLGQNWQTRASEGAERGGEGRRQSKMEWGGGPARHRNGRATV